VPDAGGHGRVAAARAVLGVAAVRAGDGLRAEHRRRIHHGACAGPVERTACAVDEEPAVGAERHRAGGRRRAGSRRVGDRRRARRRHDDVGRRATDARAGGSDDRRHRRAAVARRVNRIAVVGSRDRVRRDDRWRVRHRAAARRVERAIPCAAERAAVGGEVHRAGRRRRTGAGGVSDGRRARRRAVDRNRDRRAAHARARRPDDRRHARVAVAPRVRAVTRGRGGDRVRRDHRRRVSHGALSTRVEGAGSAAAERPAVSREADRTSRRHRAGAGGVGHRRRARRRAVHRDGGWRAAHARARGPDERRHARVAVARGVSAVTRIRGRNRVRPDRRRRVRDRAMTGRVECAGSAAAERAAVSGEAHRAGRRRRAGARRVSHRRGAGRRGVHRDRGWRAAHARVCRSRDRRDAGVTAAPGMDAVTRSRGGDRVRTDRGRRIRDGALSGRVERAGSAAAEGAAVSREGHGSSRRRRASTGRVGHRRRAGGRAVHRDRGWRAAHTRVCRSDDRRHARVAAARRVTAVATVRCGHRVWTDDRRGVGDRAVSRRIERACASAAEAAAVAREGHGAGRRRRAGGGSVGHGRGTGRRAVHGDGDRRATDARARLMRAEAVADRDVVD